LDEGEKITGLTNRKFDKTFGETSDLVAKLNKLTSSIPAEREKHCSLRKWLTDQDGIPPTRTVFQAPITETLISIRKPGFIVVERWQHIRYNTLEKIIEGECALPIIKCRE
jgi:hypothetical protein